MQPDLLTRARNASSLEEECDVIDDGLQVLSRGKLNEIHALYDLVDNVRVGRLPRPVLLGVVAALVPEGARYVMNSERGISYRSENGVRVTLHPLKMPPYMLLLIAILEASHDR